LCSYQSANGRRHQSRENQVLDAVVGYRLYAPGKLAFDEAHEQMMAEAALYCLLDGADSPAGPPRLTERIRHRLGEFLIRVGSSLQGAPALRPTVPADARSESALA
jgi:hypothetical protein